MQHGQNKEQTQRFERRARWLSAGFIVFMAAIALGGSSFTNAQTDTAPVNTSEVDDLNQQIIEKRQKIEEINRQAQTFEDTIRIKEREVDSLTGELTNIDDQQQKNAIDLQSTTLGIEKLQLEIRLTEMQLAEKRIEVGGQRDRLSDLVRRLYRERQRSMLEVIVVEKSLASFLSSLQSLTQLQDDARSGLERLAALQTDLEIEQEDLSGKQTELGQSKQRLEIQQNSLGESEQYKTSLLAQTQSSQSQFEALLNDIKGEEAAIDAEIATLEKKVRTELGESTDEPLGVLGTGPLSWPVDSTLGISAYFHDPTYPFRCTTRNARNCIGEHSAIDIRAPQGTAVMAAGDGYVAIARRLDWITDAQGRNLRPAYNYVTLLHADNLSTVYGHLSRVLVTEDTYVKKGQVIGMSGALPGTAGAGLWTTGPHLHFETRVSGIPQDPLKFLK